jgi:hypothetical protein
MNITTEQIFEFEHLDQLWERVRDLRPGLSLAARNPNIGAQGARLKISRDERFSNFTTYAARHTAPFATGDAYSFTIHKNSRRRRLEA